MKTVKIFLILVLVTFGTAKSKSFVSQAIQGIIKEYFVEKSPKIELIFHGGNDSDNKLVDEVLRNRDQLISWEVSRTFRENLWKNTLDFSSLIIFDSVQTFLASKDIPWLSRNGEHREHLVYIPNATTSDIIEHGQNGFPMQAVNFLMNVTEESIDLVSFRVVRHKTCSVSEFKKSNQFVRKSMNWKRKMFYLKDFLDIPNCTVTVNNDYLYLSGNVIGAVTHSLNYKIRFEIVKKGYPAKVLDFYFEKGDFGGIFVIEGVSFSRHELVFTVPAGDPYTQLEKMFLMFDNEVWIAIAVTLLTALVSIQILNLMSKKVRNFVYGRNIRTPTINVAATFLAGGQCKVPQRNFARFLLMLFIIWSLVIRTCYQSLLFTNLQADLRKPRISTGEELFEANLTFLNVNDDWLHLFFGNRSLNFKKAECDKFSHCLDIAAEPANKATTVTSPIIAAALENLYRSGFSSVYVLEEIISNIKESFKFPLHSPFIERFNEKIHDLHSSGLIAHWLATHVNPKGLIRKPEDIGPQVLTMEHLEVCFLICFLPLLLGLIAFVAEIGFGWWKKHRSGDKENSILI